MDSVCARQPAQSLGNPWTERNVEISSGTRSPLTTAEPCLQPGPPSGKQFRCGLKSSFSRCHWPQLVGEREEPPCLASRSLLCLLPASLSDFSSERGWAAPSPCAGSGSELGPICHPHWEAFSSPHGGRTQYRDHCLDLPATHGALGHFREDPPGAAAAEVCVAAGDKAGVGGSVKADDTLLSCCGWERGQCRS